MQRLEYRPRMQRPVCALLLAISAGGLAVACGGLEDERPLCTEEEPNDPSCGRPLTLEMVTLQVFAPSCGLTQCHSRFHQAGGLSFENPHDTRLSLLTPGGRSGPLIRFTNEQYDPLDPARSNLIKWLLPLNEVNEEVGRMPFDSPLPNIDIQLLEVWLRKAPEDENMVPIESGGLARGAQCNPDLYNGLACNDDEVVRCNEDFSFGEPQESCDGRGCRLRASGESYVAECAP